MRLYTIGHSSRRLPEFLELLRAHGVAQVADVRSHPSSRRHPQFARLHLERALPEAGIAYSWMPALGGMRRLRSDSVVHAAWREPGFRAYADHMQTEEFAAARRQLETWSRRAVTACVCAEADALRCHRQLLADAMLLQGWEVLHIEALDRVRTHELTPFARVDSQGRLTYPRALQRSFPFAFGTEAAALSAEMREGEKGSRLEVTRGGETKQARR